MRLLGEVGEIECMKSYTRYDEISRGNLNGFYTSFLLHLQHTELYTKLMRNSYT
jgi:hypothetical protein